MTSSVRCLVRVAALLGLAFLLAPSSAAAQQHLPILVQHVGTDIVGKKYVEELAVRLRSSERYEVTAVRDEALLALHLVSTDANDKDAGEASAVAITMTLVPGQENRYMHTWVVMVGRDRTEDMATALIGAIDAAVEQLKRRRAS